MKQLYVLSFLLVCTFHVVLYAQIQEQNCGTAKSVNAVHFVNADLGWAVGLNGTVLKTMDGGDNWQTTILNESHLYYDVFFTNEHTGWIGGCEGSPGNNATVVLYKKNHADSAWQRISFDHPSPIEKIQFINESTGWLIQFDGSIRKSIDGGITWQQQYKFDQVGTSIFMINENVGWAISAQHVCKTTNGGETWILWDAYLPDNDARHLFSAFFLNETTGWIVGNSEIFKTTDGGATWKDQSIWDISACVSFVNANTGLLSAGSTLYLSANGGESWQSIYALGGIGANMGEIFVLAPSHAWVIANKGVNAAQATLLKIDLTTIVGVAENGSNIVQNEFTLLQNYPNPFNPCTTISYHLATASNVSVTIYNLKGQKIETLLNQYQLAGRHEIKWMPQGLTSGIYFYQLQTDDFSETRKLILQK